MEWLAQNWIWLVLGIGLLFLMQRGGMGCGVGHGSHGHHANDDRTDRVSELDRRPKDPVTGERVDAGDINSTYQGHLYYFASRENRDKFEAAPGQYASATASGQQEHRHRRHGC